MYVLSFSMARNDLVHPCSLVNGVQHFVPEYHGLNGTVEVGTDLQEKAPERAIRKGFFTLKGIVTQVASVEHRFHSDRNA